MLYILILKQKQVNKEPATIDKNETAKQQKQIECSKDNNFWLVLSPFSPSPLHLFKILQFSYLVFLLHLYFAAIFCKAVKIGQLNPSPLPEQPA